MALNISKKEMSEEDIKLNFITPALQKRGWQDNITMETKVKFTDGKINISGNKPVRETPKRADYILYYNDTTPIAIVEAKDNNKTVSYGLQQAKEYAKAMDLKFAYSSNGDAFVEYNFFTGKEKIYKLDEFPTPENLLGQYECYINNTKGLSVNEKKIINEPFYTAQNVYKPRYYQRVAINRTVNAIARGQDRLLLVMATGTGKTYTAFQIVHRLLKSGLKNKVLYLADRNILVDQTIQQDFAPLEKVIHKINFNKDDKTTITSYKVYFSLYQQLADREDDIVENDDTLNRLTSLFDKNFFDLIIVDECHRGSAKENSNWRKILEYFSSATQIGMTATPKETKDVSNTDYFGKPLYSYSLNQGIEDGFLAPLKVYGIKTNIGDEWRPIKGQKDIYDNEIPDRIYNNRDYDYNIIINDRTREVAVEITKYLKSTDRMQKTIVFCATEDHAERMRQVLSNLNSDMMKENPDYVVRITGGDPYGKSKLDYFISVSEPYPVIATTSKLLSTGVDCKMVKLIVLDEWINSMTEFKQIIGRGTRIREDEGKMNFAVMDFRGVSRLFADPDWDGPITMSDDYKPNENKVNKDNKEKSERREIPIVDKEGCEVKIIGKTVSRYDSTGKLLKVEDIIDYTKMNIKDEYATLKKFIETWTKEEKKITIKEMLLNKGINLDEIKKEHNMLDVDDFDFICHIAYDKKSSNKKRESRRSKKN